MPSIACENFEIETGPGSGREYPVVVRSPAGEARETMHFPLDELALENRLQARQIALLRSGGQRRVAPLREEQDVHGFGRTPPAPAQLWGCAPTAHPDRSQSHDAYPS